MDVAFGSVWGGHSCPPPLKLISVRGLGWMRASSQLLDALKSKAKAADRSVRHDRGCSYGVLCMMLGSIFRTSL